jgi:hypothetical protein
MSDKEDRSRLIQSEAIRRWYNNLDEEEQYLFDERAAIMEFDAGMQRYVAERYAQRHTIILLKPSD